MSAFLQSLGSLAEEIEEHERSKEISRTVSQLPSAGSLAELHREMFESGAGYTTTQWCAMVWQILSLMIKRLCMAHDALRPQLKEAKNARHVVDQLLRDIEELGGDVDRQPTMHGAPIAVCAARAGKTASVFDDLYEVLTQNNICNGERRVLSPPWGERWSHFVGMCSGMGDVNNRLRKFCEAIDEIDVWLAKSGLLKDKPTVAPKTSAVSEDRPVLDDERDEMTGAQLEALEAAVMSELTPSSEVAEGEAAIAEAVGRASLLGGNEPADGIAAAIASLHESPGELPDEEMSLPPPRVYHRRGRPRKDQA